MKFVQFVFGGESYVGDVAPRSWLAAYAFAKIIHDYVMKTRPLFPFARSATLPRINPFEHFDLPEHPHHEPSLFQQFSRHAFRQRFAEFKRTAGNRPLPTKRLAAAPDQQGTAFVNEHTADTDNRPFGEFARRGHFLATTTTQGTPEAAKPRGGVDFYPRGI